MTAPLEGMRVLDFSIMLAGPYCARLLADVGAEVIKIEPPEGDDMRLRTPLRDGHSAYFGQLNAGKRSLALDLKNRRSDQAGASPRRRDRHRGREFPSRRDGPPRPRLRGAARDQPAADLLLDLGLRPDPVRHAERAAYAMIVHAESGFDRSLMRYAGDRNRPAAGAIFVADVLGGIFGYLRDPDRAGAARAHRRRASASTSR